MITRAQVESHIQSLVFKYSKRLMTKVIDVLEVTVNCYEAVKKEVSKK